MKISLCSISRTLVVVVEVGGVTQGCKGVFCVFVWFFFFNKKLHLEIRQLKV